MIKNLKNLVTCCMFIISTGIFAQQQAIIIIEMHRYPTKADPIHHQGGGGSPLETLPFIIKTTDENNEISEKIFDQQNRKNPIETTPLLRKEIDEWLSKGYKIFSFNVTSGSSSAKQFTVLLIKDE